MREAPYFVGGSSLSCHDSTLRKVSGEIDSSVVDAEKLYRGL